MPSTSTVKQTEPCPAAFDVLTRGFDAHVRPRMTALLDKNTRHIRAGSDIVAEDEPTKPFYWVLEGWVALNKSLQDGHVQTVDIILPSDVILPTSGGGSVSAFDVQALTDVTLSSISAAELDSLEMADPPHMWSAIRPLSAAARARIGERMLRIGHGSAEMRVAYILTELYLRLDNQCGDNCPSFHLPLTQQQIGDFSGLSSVHVCRTLRRLSRQGIIETSDHLDIVINDADALAGIANVDIDTFKREMVTPVP